jgi:hypothetical protein
MQKAFVLCRLFYKPKQNSGKVGSAKSKLSLEEQAEDHPTTNESLYENSDGMTYDTSESPDKGSKARKRKCSSKAGPPKSKRSATSVSPALEKQAEDHTTTNEFLHSENSDTIASVECSDSNSHAYASENQVAEMATVIDNAVRKVLGLSLKQLFFFFFFLEIRIAVNKFEYLSCSSMFLCSKCS